MSSATAAPTGAELGHLVLLDVEVEVESSDDEDNTQTVSIYVWTPNEVLEKDKDRMRTSTYYDCIDGMLWDDWTAPFGEFFDDDMCETGLYEANNTWDDVRLDDARIQVAYVDPLNRDCSKRCLSTAQLLELRSAVAAK